jgi:autotransporter-associated beta strand protein
MSIGNWVRGWKRSQAPKTIRRPRLGMESLEDRTTPAITAVVNAGVLTVSLSGNDNVTVGGHSATGTDVGVVAGNFPQQVFSGITGIVVNDTSGGTATNQRVGFDTVGGASRIAITGSVSVTGIEEISLNSISLPMSASNVTFSGARVVNTINSLPQLSSSGTISITAAGTGDAIGTAANPIRIAANGLHLTTNTTGGNGNQYFDLGGSANFVNVDVSLVGAINAGSGTVTLNNGEFFGVGNASDYGDSTTFNVGAAGILTLGGTETIGGLTGSGIVGGGGQGNTTAIIGGGNVSSSFSGTIVNVTPGNTQGATLSLTKIGTGGLTLTNANTYTGGTTIRNGQIQFSNSSALGTGTVTLVDANTVSGSNPTLLSTGATNLTVANNIVVGSPGQFGFLGSAGDATGSVNYTGTITLNQTMSILAGTSSTSGTRFTGRITGNGGVTVLGQTATRVAILDNPAATNDFTGAVTFGNDVILQLTQTSGAGQIPDTATVNFSTAGATLRLFIINETIAALNGGIGAVEATGTSGGLSVLTVGGGNTSGAFGGILRNGSNGVLQIVKTGTGTQTLSGDNTYTGTTTISGGTLQVGAGGTTGSLGTGAITNNGTFAVNRSNNLFVGNTIGGSGNLVKSGTGTVILTANNTYAGTTTINVGGIQVGSNGTTGTLGTGAVVNNAFLNFNRSDAHTVANAISGTGQLAQTGAGILTLTGANAYTGATQIESGRTLRVGNGGTTGTVGTGGIFNGGIIVFDRSDTLTVAANIIQGNLVRQEGTGTTILTGANTYTGTTTITVGTLQIGNGTAGNSLGSGAVTNNGSLVFNRTGNYTVANAISGSGSMNFLQNGTKSLTGTVSLNGTVTSSGGGTLLVNGTIANGSAATDVTTSGSSVIGGFGTIQGATVVTSGGSLLPGDANTVGTLNTGNVTFNAGSFFGVKMTGFQVSDSLNVTGTVNLGGATLFAIETPAALAPHFIITNDGNDPIVGTFAGLPEGATFIGDNGKPFLISYVGGDGNDVTLTPETLPTRLLATGPGTGSGLLFSVNAGQYGNPQNVSLIPGFTGEIRVARVDVNGDGTADLVAGSGPGGSRIRIISGTDNSTVIADFNAFPGFGGGVYVAGGDLNGDGFEDLVVTGDGADAFSGPVANGLGVRIYSGATLTGSNPPLLANFNGLASLSGAQGEGANVRLGGRPAVADVNGDARPDVLISAGNGGGPRVVIWPAQAFFTASSGQPPVNPIANLFVFESTQRGGAFLTAGDLNGDGFADIAVGGGPGGGPRVRTVNSFLMLGLPNLEAVNLDDPTNLANGLVLNNFFAGDGNSRGGVRVAMRDADIDGFGDLVTASGTNEQSQIRIYSDVSVNAAFGSSNEPSSPQVIDPFSAVLPGGVWIG